MRCTPSTTSQAITGPTRTSTARDSPRRGGFPVLGSVGFRCSLQRVAESESVGLTSSESESCACAAPGRLAIDGVRILARHGRHAERQGVDVNGGTMSSNCAAALVDQEAEVYCPSRCSCRRRPRSVVDTSHPVADKHGVHGRPRNSDTVLPVMGYCSGSQRLGFRSAEDVIQSWNPHSTLAGQQIDCDDVPRMTTTTARLGMDVCRGSWRPHGQCLEALES